MIRHYVTLIVPEYSLAPTRYATLFFPHKTEEQWRFAGGKIEDGELPIQAAARELKEELGVIANGLLLVRKNEPRTVDGDTWQGQYFLVEQYDGKPKITEPHKHSQLVYFTYGQLVQLGAVTAAEAIAVLEGRERVN